MASVETTEAVPTRGLRLRLTPFQALSAAVALLVVFFVVYPAVVMLVRVFYVDGQFNTEAFGRVLGTTWLVPTLINTAIAVLGGGTVAIVTASLFAWLNERTDARLKVIGDIMPIIPLLVPAVAMAIGWVFLASPGAGFINGALRAVFAPLGLNIQINVLSWPGVIFVYALYFVPYVYLIVAAAFRNIDPALEEASRLSGASMWMTLRRVSLPAIKPALIGASLLIVIVGLSLYSVPVVIANRAGIDILSVRILRSLNFEFPPRTDQAIVLSLFMLAAIAVVWMIQRRVTGSGNFATIGGKSARHVIVELGPWKWVARTFMFAYILFTSILPLAALLIVALQPFWRPVIDPSTFTLDNFYDALIGRPVTRAGLMHSLTLGIIVGIVGMLLATLMALYVKNAPRAIGRVVDGTMKFPAALSHIVIAVGFLLAFSGPPFYMSGTLVLLFIVYIILHLPEASIAATAAVSQVGKDLLEASETSGASQSRTFRKILLPLIVPGFVSGWALLFVLTAGELTASSLLAGIRNPVVGFVLLDIWEQGTFGTLAALAFTFTLITSTVVFVATLISRRGFHSR
jgi:iron(III) transport system permease protein